LHGATPDLGDQPHAQSDWLLSLFKIDHFQTSLDAKAAYVKMPMSALGH
jgi:hypothetical protein